MTQEMKPEDIKQHKNPNDKQKMADQTDQADQADPAKKPDCAPGQSGKPLAPEKKL